MKKFESPSGAENSSAGERKELLAGFDDFRRHYPPITDNISADPKEILKLPKERRGEALRMFKDILYRRRHAVAACRVDIEEATESNPAIPKRELMMIVERYADTYAFSEEQRGMFEHALDLCCELRERALAMREEFPNDADLVNELCGTDFGENEQFDISVSFIGVDMQFSAEQFEKVRVRSHHTEETKGFAKGHWSKDGGDIVCFTCINRDYAEKAEHALAMQAHETEHLKHYILMQVFKQYFTQESFVEKFGEEYSPERYAEFYKKLKRENDPKFALEIARFHLSNWRQFGYEKVRDEIFAAIQNIQTAHLSDFLKDNLLGENDAYNFLQEDAESLKEEMKDDPAFLALVERYLVTDYHRGIEEGIEAFVRLIDEGGYSKYAAVALLTDVPLRGFPNTVRRLLENE